MATYAEHKVVVDAAHPTPSLTWRRSSYDNTEHNHDDYELAHIDVDFIGVSHRFRVNAITGVNEISGWNIQAADADNRNIRGVAYGSAGTWEACKEAFRTSWEAHCERERGYLASEMVAIDILTADGITFPPLGAVKLTGLTANAAAIGNIPFTPLFSAGVLAYTATTTIPGLTITAVLPEGATIEWVHGTNAAIATASASFTLTTGGNVITATVSRPQYTSTTYTLTITRS